MVIFTFHLSVPEKSENMISGKIKKYSQTEDWQKFISFSDLNWKSFA